MAHNHPPQTQYAVMALFGEAATAPDYTGRLPAHMNVLPWFRFNNPDRAESVCDLARTARRLLILQDEFTVVGVQPRQLGKDGKTASIEVAAQDLDLAELHAMLTDGFADEYRGIQFTNPEYSGDGFLPHITPTAEVPFEVGQRMEVNSLALVEGRVANGERTPKHTIRVLGTAGLHTL